MFYAKIKPAFTSAQLSELLLSAKGLYTFYVKHRVKDEGSYTRGDVQTDQSQLVGDIILEDLSWHGSAKY